MLPRLALITGKDAGNEHVWLPQVDGNQVYTGIVGLFCHRLTETYRAVAAGIKARTLAMV
jgi:hypothetical protein